MKGIMMSVGVAGAAIGNASSGSVTRRVTKAGASGTSARSIRAWPDAASFAARRDDLP